MHKARKILIIAVLAQLGIASALCARVFGSVAINGTFSSVENGLALSVRLDGFPADVTLRGGVLHWTQAGQSDSYAPTALWNAATGFSSSSFVSLGIIGLGDGPANGTMSSYRPKRLDQELGSLAAAYIGELWYNHMHELARLNKSSSGMSWRVFKNPRAIFIGAFQIAVGKLMYDQGLDFSLASGRFRADSTASSRLAQTWLGELQAEGTGGPKANLLALTSPGIQPLQIVEGAPGVVPYADPLSVTAPEPATSVVWGCLFGLAALGVVYRRWRRK